MIGNKKIKYENYQKASELIGKLFDVESDITSYISQCIEHNGVEKFFRNIELFEFDKDVYKKLCAVRFILLGVAENSMIDKEGGETSE